MESHHTPKNWHEKTQNFLKQIAESNKTTMTIYGLGTLLVIIVIFQAGMIVGTRRGFYQRSWNENYRDNFPMPMHAGVKAQAPTAHGTAGTIISISLPTMVVQDQDGREKIVLIRDTTIIKSGTDTTVATSLLVGDMIVAIGTPNQQGQLLANLIRIMPTEQPINE